MFGFSFQFCHKEERKRKETKRREDYFILFCFHYSIMASSSSSSFVRCFLLLLFFCFSLVQAAKVPFHPRDVLPLLPRQVSWPILNSLSSAVDLLPAFVGSVSSQNRGVEWKGACFYENTAWMEFHNKSGSQFGGGTLHIKVTSLASFFGLVLVFKFFFLMFGIWVSLGLS